MTVALIVAAGRGHRLGGPIPKQYRLLEGVPILRRTAEALRRHAAVRAVRVVINPVDRGLYDEAMGGLGLAEPVTGGASRQESVRNGLESIAALAPETVLIHDGVRPFVDTSTIGAVLDALARVPGAVVGVPVTDTLKRCRGAVVTGTVDRADLWRAQTPQGFRYEAILGAHRRAHAAHPGRDFTDDCAVAELAGLTVEMVPGSEENFKITTEADLLRAEAMLRERGRFLAVAS
ncbi:MAG: 2-C-methyl-D-erythritol 4-phosphate cytidylyltransferase [Acidiphilium sp. 37-67-22]|nr:MAG: 2-C-methyl-D-erythritol 4-phosphate cytidylyltransferase [Acidiphilium sp. 37-67-22]HQT72752.1 2-C-methyl-D-erythritol 4-phosphate cytidylyltransferase [Acidiphilium sp.]